MQRASPYDLLRGSDCLTPPPSYEQDDESLTSPDIAPSPTRAFSFSNSLTSSESNADSLSVYPARTLALAAPERPPEYAAFDGFANTFYVCGSIIYSTQTSHAARYQLQQEFTRSRRPKRLHIRRLCPRQSRALSQLSDQQPSTFRFDEDDAMFTMTDCEMKANTYREAAVRGSIRLETGINLRGKWCRIYRVTKSLVRDSLDPKNERNMEKYGYHSNDEWDKSLLFCIRKDVWENQDGRRVAVERRKGRMELHIEQTMDPEKRDLLVSCWIMRIWMCQGLRCVGDAS